MDNLAPIKERKLSRKKIKTLPNHVIEAKRKCNQLKKELKKQLNGCGYADKIQVRAYRKHRNYTSRVLNKILKNIQGINITEESSVKDCYKACEEVLRPDKLAKNRMKLKKEEEIVENTKDLIKMFNEFFRNKP